jgi:CubicO group peptidase (beta-lactamase class C family)
MQSGLTVLSRAYGMADLEHDIPNTPSTIFEAGSVSKQFTSAAIVLLALEGKLSLDDDVRKYVPEVPDYGKTITFRHLMTHTSGLRDWGSVAEISGWGRQNRTHRHAHVLDIVSRQSALNFEPGHEYSYSNTGYNLLAIVVSRVSGMQFAEFSKKRIFGPVGMTSTEWRDDYTRIVKGRSSAYSVRNADVSIMRPIEDVHGNGGLLTTVSDLLLWNRALAEGRLGGSEFVRLMHQQGRLNDGTEITYASGLVVDDFAGVPSVTHTGSTSGYRAFLGRYPEHDLSVAMLCNASNVPTSETGGKIARVYLGGAAKTPPEPREYMVPIEALEARVGVYRNARTGIPVDVELHEGRLRVDGRFELVPTGANELQAGAGGPRFVFEGASVRMFSEDGEEALFERVERFTPSAGELRAFAGRFYSSDAETELDASVVDSDLVLRRRPDWSVTLAPKYEDAFDAPDFGLVRFRRGPDGRVVELSLRQPRVYDLRFERIGESGAATSSRQ